MLVRNYWGTKGTLTKSKNKDGEIVVPGTSAVARMRVIGPRFGSHGARLRILVVAVSELSRESERKSRVKYDKKVKG